MANKVYYLGALGTAFVALAAGSAVPAAAQTSETHYAGVNRAGNDYAFTNPTIQGRIDRGERRTGNGLGTRYTAEADAPDDSETATPEVNIVFTLSGSVNKDCSFYAGNTTGARDIDFGVIGVRTGDYENVSNAFEMVGPAVADIETLTAGCNFDNVVEIVKDDVRGMVNNAPGGYDTNEFQANIPYEVTANWTGVAQGAVTTGSGQTLNVPTTDLSGTLSQGAWRSDMQINITAPAITTRGLVAGDYSGTTTLTLRAI